MITFQWGAVIAGGLIVYLVLSLSQKEREDEQREHEEERDRLNHMIVELLSGNTQAIADNIVSKIQDTDCRVSMSPGGLLIEVYLTGQDLKIIAHVVQGMSNQEIGDKMNLAEGTVRNIVSTILGKLGLSSREQLAIYAIKKELVGKNDESAVQTSQNTEVPM